jgi:diaminopimelate decarboxylase
MALYKIFNIPPQEPAVSTCPSIEGFAEEIAGYLNSFVERHGLKKPILLLEPGRALTGDAQILLVTVGEIKTRNHGLNYAITDGGMQNVAFPLSYEYHKCFLANRAGTGISNRYHVTGPLCSPEDLLFRNRELPELKRGDVLSIMDAGAYFTSFSNNFSYPRPAAVSVRNGSHKIMRDRENFKHMTGLDRI